MLPMKTIFFCLFYCSVVSSGEMADIEQKYILLIGGPGVGKSLLFNSLLGKRIAEPQVNFAQTTKSLRVYAKDEMIFIDSPGVENTRNNYQALEEIEKALKMNGRYSIFLS